MQAEESCYIANYREVLLGSALRFADLTAGRVREHLARLLPRISHRRDVRLLGICPFPLPSGQWTAVMDNNRSRRGQFLAQSRYKRAAFPRRPCRLAHQALPLITHQIMRPWQ